MNLTKKIIFIYLILFFISISLVSAENTDNQTVTSILNDDTNSIPLEKTQNTTHQFSELQNDINNAKTGATISLGNDYSYNSNFSQNGILINKQITINGNGKILDGANRSRIFSIAADNVVINDLIMINGFNRYAGAISCVGSNLILNNCTFINNVATITNGGALSITNNGCKITNSYFKDNTAKNSGGAFLLNGNGQTISNNTFINNKAVNTLGGAFYISGNNTTITNNNFTQNFANFSGGAMRVEGHNTIAFNNYFKNNTAKIFLGGGACILGDNNTVDNNQFINNFAGRDGGGLNMEGSIVEENGIRNIIRNNYFTENVVLQYGAGIGTDCQYVNIINNTLIKNYAGRLGGAIRISGALKDTGNIVNNTMKDNYAGVSGGALYIMGNGTFIAQNIIINNTADTVAGGAINIHGNDSTIKDNIIDKVSAKISGGAIFWEGNNAKLLNNIITNAYSGSSGGAVHLEGSSPTIKNNKINKNTAETIGAGLQIKSSNALIENNEFKNNLAKSSGGAIYIQGNNIKITDNDFISNNAGQNSIGGAIRLIGNYASINENYFVKNTAKEGLSISGYGNYRTIENNNFINKDKTNEIVWSGDKYKPEIIFNAKTIAVTSSNKVLTATLKDSNGNVISNKEISFTINGKTYKAKTNDNGLASAKITLNVIKKYTAIARFAGDDTFDSVSNSATVTITKEKTKLTAPKKTFKRLEKNKKVTITLKSNSNKLLTGKKIILKVNGKTYTSKTNKKGQITFNVKLTKKKTYAYTVKFNGDKQYYSISKNSKIIIK